ncbi:hypothetical protein BN1050_00486 [Metalysinibacillus saudimassiliensis]|uniref:DUF4007 domain-containing protein n=1 Tax=Metalysinibacillus saudimassiliensis TaxID=1461583 RepID=A0A078M1P8_9BACL|nr:hypothetical protein BN1050_00486 [Metalysinibacillus saudimassiliensis]
MAFGQHQTFYLRLTWLYKGLHALQQDSTFFQQSDSFEELGVGKNMAQSIRHWLQATKVVEQVGRKAEYILTPLGEAVVSHDPYLQDEYTIGLLHYKLVTDAALATTWYWFFNSYDERVVTKDSLIKALTAWTTQTQLRPISSNSLERDVNCLLQTYLPKQFENATPEDIIQSPFEQLGLLGKTTNITVIKQPLVTSRMADILFTTLLMYMENHQISEVNLQQLINEPELWGRVFNLSQSEIVEEIAVIQKKYPLIFTRTNRLDVLRIDGEYSVEQAIAQAYGELKKEVRS